MPETTRGRHDTLNTLLTRESGLWQDREAESHKAHILENGGSNPYPAINLVGITLSVYRRSMIRLNLSHEKRLLLILLSAVRSEKHNGM